MEPFDFHEFYEKHGQTETEETGDAKIRRQFVFDVLEKHFWCLEIGCAEGHMTEGISNRTEQTVSTDIAFSFLLRAKKRI